MNETDLKMLIDTIAIINVRMLRVVQDGMKVLKLMREVEDSLYEVRAKLNREASLGRGSLNAADAKAQDTR